jgi:hypothetical protein
VTTSVVAFTAPEASPSRFNVGMCHQSNASAS